MKRPLIALLALAMALCSVAASSPVWAAGGSGGGGGGGGTATGGGTKTCSPTLGITATASTVVGERSLALSYTTSCASKTRVYLNVVNTATGVTEWTTPSDSTLSSYTWNGPLFGTTYRVDGRMLSSTGALLTTATATVTTLPAPADCGPFLGATAGVGTTAADYGVRGNYSLVWCGGAANVLVSFVNTTTNVTEFQQYAGVSTSVIFPNPQFSTTYRVDVTAYDAAGQRLAIASSAPVTTIATPPNCATITNSSATVGYWGVYAAVWVSTTAKDCGYGMTSVHLRITNLNSTGIEYEIYGMGLSTMIDFEGPIVKYDTPYQVDVDVRGASGEVLDSRNYTLVTPPLK